MFAETLFLWEHELVTASSSYVRVEGEREGLVAEWRPGGLREEGREWNPHAQLKSILAGGLGLPNDCTAERPLYALQALGWAKAALNMNLEGKVQNDTWVRFWGNRDGNNYYFLGPTLCQAMN